MITKRYIWLGDSQYGGSAFWDKKREVVVRTNTSPLVSAEGSQKNPLLILIVLPIMIFIRSILFFFEIGNTPEEPMNNLILFMMTICFTIVFTSLIKKAIYGKSSNYVESTFEDGMYAIKSTGYLKNPYIYMMVDKVLLKLIFLVMIVSIAERFLGLDEIFTGLIHDLIFLLIFISPVIRMVYVVSFKKENHLKL